MTKIYPQGDNAFGSDVQCDLLGLRQGVRLVLPAGQSGEELLELRILSDGPRPCGLDNPFDELLVELGLPAADMLPKAVLLMSTFAFAAFSD